MGVGSLFLQDQDRGGGLILNEIVVRYTSPLERVQYQVVGTKKNCSVFPHLPPLTDSVNKYFCDCPAFTLSVLLAESNLMARYFLFQLFSGWS